jgi:hypothetical protein
MERTVKLTTYGPNHGLTLDIGTYHFDNGVCEISEKDAGSAASVLCRYHDVCFEHELEAKLAEYQAIAEQNAQAAVSTPIPENPQPAPEPAAPEAPVNPEPAPEPELFTQPNSLAAGEAATESGGEGTEANPNPSTAAPADPAPAPEAEQPKPQGNKRHNKQS